MLVITRQATEKFMIDAYDQSGNPVVVAISLIDIQRDKVRIGIDAPVDIRIRRDNMKLVTRKDFRL